MKMKMKNAFYLAVLLTANFVQSQVKETDYLPSKKFPRVKIDGLIVHNEKEDLSYYVNYTNEFSRKNKVGFEIGAFMNNTDDSISSKTSIFNLGLTKGIKLCAFSLDDSIIQFSFGTALGTDKEKFEETETGGFVYGTYLGVSTDFYLNEKFSLVFRCNKYFLKSELSSSKLFYGAGLRYKI